MALDTRNPTQILEDALTCVDEALRLADVGAWDDVAAMDQAIVRELHGLFDGAPFGPVAVAPNMAVGEGTLEFGPQPEARIDAETDGLGRYAQDADFSNQADMLRCRDLLEQLQERHQRLRELAELQRLEWVEARRTLRRAREGIRAYEDFG